MSNNIVQHRRGTRAEWLASVVIPADGEILIEENPSTGSRRCKIGDDKHYYKDLSYVDAEAIALNTALQKTVETEIEKTNKKVSEVDLKLEGLETSVQSLVQPTIEGLDAKYSEELSKIRNKYDAEISVLKDDLDNQSTAITSEINTKVSKETADRKQQISDATEALQIDVDKKLSDVLAKSKTYTNETVAGNADSILQIENSLLLKIQTLQSSIQESINQLSSKAQADDSALLAEINTLKEMGFGDSISASMVGQVNTLNAEVSSLKNTDRNVLAKLTDLDATLSTVAALVNSLDTRIKNNANSTSTSIEAVETKLSEADNRLLEHFNEEFTKVWAEITDLVDDDLLLYQRLLAFNSSLKQKIQQLENTHMSDLTALEADTKKQIEDTKDTLNNTIASSKSDITALVNRIKAELENTIEGNKKLSEAADDDLAAQINTLTENVNAGYSELVGQIEAIDNTRETDYNSLNGELSNLGTTVDGLKVQDTKIATDILNLNQAVSDNRRTIATLMTASYPKDENATVTELEDARRDYKGYTHDFAGNAIRQVGYDLQAFENKAAQRLYYDITGDRGIKRPYMLYLTDKQGNLINESAVQVVAGSGGGGTGTGAGSSSVLTLLTDPDQGQAPTFLENERVELKFTFSGTDAAGEDIFSARAEWYIGDMGRVEVGTVNKGDNTIDLTEYISIGPTTSVTLYVTDSSGKVASKDWYVTRVSLSVSLDNSFNESNAYIAGAPLTLYYLPICNVDHTCIIKLDGEELLRRAHSKDVSGQKLDYTIDGANLTHGTHALEIYLEAVVSGNKTTKSNSILKNILCMDSATELPIIGLSIQENLTIDQYSTVNFRYAVYDPADATPSVTIIEENIATGAEVILFEGELRDSNSSQFTYLADQEGEYRIKVCCKDAVEYFEIQVNSIETSMLPVSADLAFDFNPAGRSNGDSSITNEDVWFYQNGTNTYTMSVSDNFDWENGGFITDMDGGTEVPCFCIKSGTYATIDYDKLFKCSSIESTNNSFGREFKLVFKTKNVTEPNTEFLACYDESASSPVGLKMQAHSAYIYSTNNALPLEFKYSENDLIEFDFSIKPDSSQASGGLLMVYEDGTPSLPYVYASAGGFNQTNPSQIVLGSPDCACDLYVYRMRIYERGLSDTEVLQNFKADARTSEAKLERFARNDIFSNNKMVTTSASGGFNADKLMAAAPDLRYVFLEVPYFTNDKNNKINGGTVYFRYPNGKRPEDNWTWTGVTHSGQGTSSNTYGLAGRNIDIRSTDSNSKFTYVDANNEVIKASTISLTSTSIPTNYLNIKVNIASSENANNAELARRFNEYQPFKRYARLKDSRVKDTMEFYNCVIFIRETSDVASHREFNDTDWHFYALGNIGDSKKTDSTRVNNATDEKEHIVEIMDVGLPLYNFPTEAPITDDVTGEVVTHNWQDLMTMYTVEEDEIKSFGHGTYEFRYEKDGITKTEQESNINAWKSFYEFVVTSTNEEFKNDLHKYFVVDSALYYYLFTERYTMVDNRAKNSFWHYGKVYISNTEAENLGAAEASYYIVNDEEAAFNEGYRYDLTHGYDFDTALGIDNTGKNMFSYGKEDTDRYDDSDPSSRYVFRAADSTFFCKLRDNFAEELQALYTSIENMHPTAWSASSLITQFDTQQAKFPEELWRFDYERKYYRPFAQNGFDNSIIKEKNTTFLTDKFFGRKKYARRSFEVDQEYYFASKYFGATITAESNQISIRSAIPDSIEKPDYTLEITPYTDMYLWMKFGSTSAASSKLLCSKDGSGKKIRVKAGDTYKFDEPVAVAQDMIFIYGSDRIQAIGDLSLYYPEYVTFAAASRIQEINVGNQTEGYSNGSMKEIPLTGSGSASSGNALKYLDATQVTGATSSVSLEHLPNLEEFYAAGTNITGVTFANGGKLTKAVLPEKLQKLVLQNLKNISANDITIVKNDLTTPYFNGLKKIIVEDCPKINPVTFIENYPNLTHFRLSPVTFGTAAAPCDYAKTFENYFNASTKYGLNAAGNDTDYPVLIGEAYFDTLSGAQYNTLRQRYGDDLKVSYNILNSTVTFKNCGEAGTDLQVTVTGTNSGTGAVYTGTDLYLPEGAITPTKNENDAYTYNFVGWSKKTPEVQGMKFTNEDFGVDFSALVNEAKSNSALQDIRGDITLYPVFEPEIKSYTVEFRNPTGSNSYIELCSEKFNYGEYFSYPGSISDLQKQISPSELKVLFKHDGWSASCTDELITDDNESQLKITGSGFTVLENREVYAVYSHNPTTMYTLKASDLDASCFNPDTYEIKLAKLALSSGIDKKLGLIIPKTVEHNNINYEITALDKAFKNYSNLMYINLPDTIKTINNRALEGCKKLYQINIPSNTTSIGQTPFIGCDELVNLEISKENTKYSIDSNGLLLARSSDYSDFDTAIEFIAGVSTAGTDIEIPNSISNIGEYCFAHTGITSLVLPTELTSIPGFMCYNCKDLKSVVLPDSLTTIEASGFSGTALAKIVIPKEVNSIGVNAFSNTTALQNIYLSYESTDLDSVTKNFLFNNADRHAGSIENGITIHLPGDKDSYADYDTTFGLSNLTGMDVEVHYNCGGETECTYTIN